MATPHHPDTQMPGSNAPRQPAFDGGGLRPVALVTGAARRIGRTIADAIKEALR